MLYLLNSGDYYKVGYTADFKNKNEEIDNIRIDNIRIDMGY